MSIYIILKIIKQISMLKRTSSTGLNIDYRIVKSTPSSFY